MTCGRGYTTWSGRSSIPSSGRCGQRRPVRFTASRLVLTLLLLSAIGCVAPPAKVVFVPTLPNLDPEPVEAARPFKVPIVVMVDGKETISEVKEFPAGVMIVWPQKPRVVP